MYNMECSAFGPHDPLFELVTGIPFNNSVPVQLQDGIDSFGSGPVRLSGRERTLARDLLPKCDWSAFPLEIAVLLSRCF